MLDEELSALGGEQRVVVCHSLGCLGVEEDPYSR